MVRAAILEVGEVPLETSIKMNVEEPGFFGGSG
jgi:hypothetical protein